MDKTFKYIISGLIVIAIFVLWFFNFSFSLSTTFKEMLDKQIKEDEQLVITELDVDRIHKLRIEKPYSLDEKDVFEITDKEKIRSLLDSDLRISKGANFIETKEEYMIYIHFYGSLHIYTIAEEYIRLSDGKYKVLDENNEIYHFIHSLYNE